MILCGIANIIELSFGMKIDPQISFGKSVIAVEPGNEWFKLVHVSQGRGRPVIEKVILKRAEEVDGLVGSDFLKAMGLAELEGIPVVACLPRQMVNVRLFDLPSGDQQEIADMVDLQIARQTPYSRDEIVFDYRLFRSDKEGYTRVMLVIAQTGVVRQKYRMLEESGVAVGLVSVTTDGWLAALQSGDISFVRQASGAVAFLDMDSTSGDLVVLNEGVPLFSRSMPVGVTQLLEGGDRQVDICAREIGRALEIFRNETPAVSVSSLVLGGAAARLPALAAGLKAALSMEVAVIDGIERLANEHVVNSECKGVSLAGVLGAAVRAADLQINLMPESVMLRKTIMMKARQLTGTGILAMAIVGLLSLFIVSRLNREETYIEELQRMIKGTTQLAENVEAMRNKVGIVSERVGSKMIPANVLYELYNVTGDGTAYTSIEITDASQLTCRGTSETVADVVKLVNTMEASPLFQNVKNTRTVSGKDRTEFEISCELEKRRP